MAAPTIGHLICTMALVILIFVLPYFYANVTNNIKANVVQRELQEVADYISNTFENLYFLVNGTTYSELRITKDLLYLPATVEDSFFIVRIDEIKGNASRISVHLKNNPSNHAVAWLAPGLKVGSNCVIESGRRVIACCRRDATGVYVWVDYG